MLLFVCSYIVIYNYIFFVNIKFFINLIQGRNCKYIMQSWYCDAIVMEFCYNSNSFTISVKYPHVITSQLTVEKLVKMGLWWKILTEIPQDTITILKICPSQSWLNQFDGPLLVKIFVKTDFIRHNFGQICFGGLYTRHNFSSK